MKKRFLTLGTLLILAIFLAGCRTAGRPGITLFSPEGPVDVQIEVARTAAERKQGLMERTVLEAGTGMLFIFDPEDRPSMWMKNMLIPLDLVFIGADKTVNHIENNAPPCAESEAKNCPQYTSKEAASFVLELPAGYAKEKGIRPGDRTELLNVSGF